MGRRGASCHASRLNNDADANPPQGPRYRKTRKPYRTAMPRKIIFVQRCNSDHACVNARTPWVVRWCERAERSEFGRKIPPHRHAGACASPKRLRPRRRDKPGHDGVLLSRRSKRAKLLRGQALPDMRGLRGKVAENCRESSLETLQIRKLFRDRAEVSCGAAAHVLGCLHSHNWSREAKGFTTLVRR